MESKAAISGFIITLIIILILGLSINGRLQIQEDRLVDLSSAIDRITFLEAEVKRLTSELEVLKLSHKPSIIAIRLDDVQDFAFRDAQLFLLNYHMSSGIPISLAVIPDLLKSDSQLIAEIGSILKIGAEVSAHGLTHEDFTKLSLSEQELRLSQARASLKGLFGINTSVLVPPMFKYNDDTLTAMNRTGFDTISSSIELQLPGLEEQGIAGVPATVEFTDFVNETWRAKSVDRLLLEVGLSIERYGYAVIVLHPQELMSGNELDNGALQTYENLINRLNEDYSFTVLRELRKLTI